MSVSEKKRVLVTGGTGYIGSHVVLELLLTGRYLPVVIDNFHNSKRKAIDRIEEIARDTLGESAGKVDIFAADLNSLADVEKVFKSYEGKGGIWGVIHVAAWKAVGESGELPLLYYQNNVSASITLVDVMAKYKCYNMVYSSSATVYGVPEQIPIPESTPMVPASVYGRTKYMCETIMKDICRADSNFACCSLRYFNPGGCHPSGKIGEDPQGKPGNLLPLLGAMAVGRYTEGGLKVFGTDYPTEDGTCVRDYLHVVDLAQGHILALDGVVSGSIFQNGVAKGEGRYKAYNLGRGKASSVLQIIAAMEKATGHHYEYEVIGRRDGDVPDLTADPTLAEAELKFYAKKNLEEMCADLWRWQTNNPKGYEA